MLSTSRYVLLAAFLVTGSLPNLALAHDDKHEIIHLMKGIFETPENPLSVDPVVIVGDNAIAGWVQGERGGRALLLRVHSHWQIRLCSGDGLKDPKLLESANISTADAGILASQLTEAESKLDPLVLAKLSSFEGTMMIDHGSGDQGHNHGLSTTPE